MMMKAIKTLLVTLTLLLALAGCSKTEYDPHAYTDLKFTGLSGYATAEVAVTGTPSGNQERENLAFLLAKTTYEITPNEGLKNDDVVKVKPVYDEKLAKEKGFKPVIREREVVVTGLQEPKKIVTLFEDTELEYVGAEGSGFALLHYVGSDTIIDKLIKYKTPDSLTLKNGDSITVIAMVDEALATKEGYVFIGDTTKTFTVEGLPPPKE